MCLERATVRRLACWNGWALGKNELEQLSTILYHNNIRGEEAEKNLKRVFKEIKGQSEDVWGFVWTKITG